MKRSTFVSMMATLVFLWSATLSSALPDLTASVTSLPSSASPGGAISIGYKVSRTGDACGSSGLKLYLSRDAVLDASDTYLSPSVSIPAMSLNASSIAGTTSRALPSSLAAGTWYVIAQADGFGAVAESNEANNTGSRSFQVAPGLPDLTIVNLNASPATVPLNSKIALSFGVKNGGGLAASLETNVVRLSTNGSMAVFDGDLLGNLNSSSIAAGATDSKSASYTMTKTGTFYIKVMADAPNSVVESNENNNIAVVGPITVPLSVDLSVTNLSVSPLTLCYGGSIVVQFGIRNSGSSAAPGSIANEVRVSTNNSASTFDGDLLGNLNSASIAAGVTDAKTGAYTINKTGTFYVKVKADSGSSVTETNEANNIAVSGAITVAAPDLKITGLTVSPSTLNVGQSVTVQVGTTNAGGCAAGGWTSEVRLSTNNSSSTFEGDLLGSYGAGSLGVGATDSRSGTYTIASSGVFYVKGKADVGSNVAESDENNNVAVVGPIAVSAGGTPTVAVSPSTITLTCPGSSSSSTPASLQATSAAPKAIANLDLVPRDADGKGLIVIRPAAGLSDAPFIAQAVRGAGGRVKQLLPEGDMVVAAPLEALATIGADPAVGGLAPAQFPDTSLPAVAPGTQETHGLGSRPPTPEESAYIRSAISAVSEIEPNALSVARAALQGAATLPTFVDNSPSRYFPPIGSQGAQGSCTAWAGGYYYNTYTQAMDEDLAASDITHQCSPAFLYPLVNGGVDSGANTAYVVARLVDIGCANRQLMPYSASDFTTWPTEAAWIEALSRRMKNAHSVAAATLAQLDTVKQLLANGQIAVTSFPVYHNWYDAWSSLPDNPATGIQNGVLFSGASSGLVGYHAATVVGYDDNRSYNDGATTRHGAFLLANSWGAGGTTNTAGSRGFIWVAYDYFMADFGYVLYDDDRAAYRPRFYAAVGIDATARGQITVSGGIGPNSAPSWTAANVISDAGGTSVGLASAKRIVVDLTEGLSSVAAPGTVNAFVRVDLAAGASSAASEINLSFFRDDEGDGTAAEVVGPTGSATIPAGASGYLSAAVPISFGSRINIANTGTARLTVNPIQSDATAGWLTWTPATSLSIAPASSEDVYVAVDCTKAPAGGETRQLYVDTNDPAASRTTVTVSVAKPLPAGQITVTAPAAGEVWHYGEQHTIRWSYSGISDSQYVQVRMDYPGSSNALSNTVPISVGVYTFTVPSSFSARNDWVAVVTWFSPTSPTGDVWDTSDPMTIGPGTSPTVADDFSNGLAKWMIKTNSWSIDAGWLLGKWNIGCGSASSCEQAAIVLADQYQPTSENWRMEADFTYSGIEGSYTQGQRSSAQVNFVLWYSSTSKEVFGAGWRSWNWDGSNPHQIGFDHSTWQPWTDRGSVTAPLEWEPKDMAETTGHVNHAALEKHGDQLTLTITGRYGAVSKTWTKVLNQGLPKLGFNTYGWSKVDNFQLTILP